eukprot:7024139-Alexandrium_andersonii.AAC.1
MVQGQAGAPAVPLWPSRPIGRGRTASTKVHWGPLKATRKWAQYHWRKCPNGATWDAAPWSPKLLCKRSVADSRSPEGAA